MLTKEQAASLFQLIMSATEYDHMVERLRTYLNENEFRLVGERTSNTSPLGDGFAYHALSHVWARTNMLWEGLEYGSINFRSKNSPSFGLHEVRFPGTSLMNTTASFPNGFGHRSPQN